MARCAFALAIADYLPFFRFSPMMLYAAYAMLLLMAMMLLLPDVAAIADAAAACALLPCRL